MSPAPSLHADVDKTTNRQDELEARLSVVERQMRELNAIADEVRKIVVEEVRRAFREHENQLTSLVRNAVAQATPK
jgi:hypothetical protein